VDLCGWKGGGWGFYFKSYLGYSTCKEAVGN
jgi:hypothetical protein